MRKHRWYTYSPPTQDERKPALSRAFSKLRRDGFIALQNFSCCRSCAGAEIVARVQKLPARKKDALQGCILYTRQDADDLKLGGDLWIGFGPVEVDGVEYGRTIVQVGQALTEALRLEGLEVEWDGTGDTRVCVIGARTRARRERDRRDDLALAAAAIEEAEVAKFN